MTAADLTITEQLVSGFKEDSLFYLTIQPDTLKVHGTGVGDNIQQLIERDERNPRLWDMTNSKILHIQLLDAFTFRSVTGMELSRHPTSAVTSMGPSCATRKQRDDSQSSEYDDVLLGSSTLMQIQTQSLRPSEPSNSLSNATSNTNSLSPSATDVQRPSVFDSADSWKPEDPSLSDYQLYHAVGPEVQADTYDAAGRYHGDLDIITLDVDDTLPGLQSL